MGFLTRPRQFREIHRYKGILGGVDRAGCSM